LLISLGQEFSHVGFEYRIALKQMSHRKKTGFIPLISLISMTGIAVGVMALIVVLSVMSGFDRELKSKIIGMQPHLIIEKVGGVDSPDRVMDELDRMKLKGLKHAHAFTQGQGLIRSQTNAMGVLVRGIDGNGDELSAIKNHLIEGNLKLDAVRLEKAKKAGEIVEVGRVVMGSTLAQILGVRAGDVIYIISPKIENEKSILPTGARTLPFQVAGVYEIGMNDFDSGLALVSLQKASELFGMENRVTGIGIKFENPMMADAMKPIVQSQLPFPYIVRSWVDLNRNFFGALRMEKIILTILMTLVVLVAAFNIVSTLTMVVMEKTKDIGIMRALGATQGSVQFIFMLQGLVQGLIGTGLGAGLGLLIAHRLNDVAYFLERTFHIEIFPKDVYNFDKIPTQIGQQDVVFIITFAVFLSLLAGLYPAYRASRVRVTEALRYE
jgi:lipoprotein-releasing system permease protein